ncbi:MAG: hypothetical protein FWD34_10380 [Oscillospiraceae bacterium]|nr:hypothetical protein [Oscillospiraceae bacterium]
MNDKALFNYIDNVKLSDDLKEQLIRNSETAADIHDSKNPLVRNNFIMLGSAVAAICLICLGGWFVWDSMPAYSGGDDPVLTTTADQDPASERQDFDIEPSQIDTSLWEGDGSGFNTLLRLLDRNSIEYEVHDSFTPAGSSNLSVGYYTVFIGDEMINVYDYSEKEFMETDASGIDIGGSSITKISNNGMQTAMISWVSEPHWFKSDKTIVFYCGTNSDILNFLNNYYTMFAGFRYINWEYETATSYEHIAEPYFGDYLDTLTAERIAYYQEMLGMVHTAGYWEDYNISILPYNEAFYNLINYTNYVDSHQRGHGFEMSYAPSITEEQWRMWVIELEIFTEQLKGLGMVQILNNADAYETLYNWRIINEVGIAHCITIDFDDGIEENGMHYYRMTNDMSVTIDEWGVFVESVVTGNSGYENIYLTEERVLLVPRLFTERDGQIYSTSVGMSDLGYIFYTIGSTDENTLWVYSASTHEFFKLVNTRAGWRIDEIYQNVYNTSIYQKSDGEWDVAKG